MSIAAFEYGSESHRQIDVPRGDIQHWQHESTVFDGTHRDVWLYTPPGAQATLPYPLMVFLDGEAYLDEQGWFRASIVLDNLIHRRELRPMAALFVNAGHTESDGPASCFDADNRSVEFDTVSNRFAVFLIDELLPITRERINLSDHATDRGICGFSSGGIAAFGVVWHRPDAFGKVMSHCGSFADIRGGHAYPFMIRRKERKPIRVFLQAGRNDLDVEYGNWWLCNQQMASALAFKQYDYQLVFGDGEHDGTHGGSILPASLQWLWRD